MRAHEGWSGAQTHSSSPQPGLQSLGAAHPRGRVSAPGHFCPPVVGPRQSRQSTRLRFQFKLPVFQKQTYSLEQGNRACVSDDRRQFQHLLLIRPTKPACVLWDLGSWKASTRSSAACRKS